jgi:hypothetical protein
LPVIIGTLSPKGSPFIQLKNHWIGGALGTFLFWALFVGWAGFELSVLAWVFAGWLGGWPGGWPGGFP